MLQSQQQHACMVPLVRGYCEGSIACGIVFCPLPQHSQGSVCTAVVYISELAGTNRRGTFVACLQMSVNIGMIIATLVVMIVENTMSSGARAGVRVVRDLDV